MRALPAVVADDRTKDGSIAQERLAFFIGTACRFRVWWSHEAQVASPGGDLFEGILRGVVPIGRDYYFIIETGPSENPKRSILKTAVVLQITEI